MSWRPVLAAVLVVVATSGALQPAASPAPDGADTMASTQTASLAGHGVRQAAHQAAQERLGPNETHALLGAPGATWPCPTTDLDAAYACLKQRMPGAGSLGYHAPSPAEAAAWTELASDLLASTDCTATIPTVLAGVVAFVRLDAGGPDADVCILAETGDANGDGRSDHGWGGLALRLGAPNAVHLQAPHPIYDIGTGEEAVGAFGLADGVRSVTWAGAHRYANSPLGGPDGSDMAEAVGSVFMATLDALLAEADANAAFLSLHAMLDAACASDVFLTTGQARVPSPGEPVLNLRDELREAYNSKPGNHSIDAPGDRHPDPDCILTGENNIQGMKIRGQGRTFIHIEAGSAYHDPARTAAAVAAADLNDSLGNRNPAWPCPTTNLTAAYGCLKDRMGQAGSTAYEAPNQALRQNWTALAADVLATNTCTRSLVPPILHGLVEPTLLDAPHANVCVVAEVVDENLDHHSDLGWGGFAVDLTGTRDMHLLVPYPYYHTGTGEHAVAMFAALPGTRSVAWAGAHRLAMPDRHAPGELASDAAVRGDTMLMASLEASLAASGAGGVFVNLHAFADNACPDSPIYLTPANGTVPPTNGPTAALRDALTAEFGFNVTMYGDDPPCNLGEMRVAQSGPVSAAGRTFILALAEHAYQDGTRWALAADTADLGE